MRRDTHVIQSHFPHFPEAADLPISSLTKPSIRYPNGKMGEIESIHGYPKIRLLRRLARETRRARFFRAADVMDDKDTGNFAQTITSWHHHPLPPTCTTERDVVVSAHTISCTKCFSSSFSWSMSWEISTKQLARFIAPLTLMRSVLRPAQGGTGIVVAFFFWRGRMRGPRAPRGHAGREGAPNRCLQHVSS